MKKNICLWFLLCCLCSIFSASALAQTVINELDINPGGTDNPCEYIELKGPPSAILNDLHFVSIEGDIGSNPGVATAVVTFAGPALGTNGLLVVTGTQPCGTRTYPAGTTVAQTSLLDTASGALQNGTNSFLLISSTTAITPGTDYDTNNDGTLESLPAGATIVDGVAWSDGGAGDITYGSTVLSATGGTIGACTRFPGNTTANSVAAWYAGAMTGTNDATTYSPTVRTANFPANGALTPGDVNVGTAADANVDMDGDGKSDYVVVRGTGAPITQAAGPNAPRFDGARAHVRYDLAHADSLTSPSATSEFWYTFTNGSGAVSITQWGDAIADWNVPDDYDGDGKDDVAIWRPGAPGIAGFYIFQSSNSTLRFAQFGETGHNPSVVADYDGDGKADPATFTCVTPLSPSQCFIGYDGSLNNPSSTVTYVNWGFGTINDFSPIPGDFDGDGKADFCLQRADPAAPSQGQFALLKSNGLTAEFIDWGLPNDTVIPGDYDGDGKTDFMIFRASGGTNQHYLLTRTGAVRIATWGVPGDESVPGDYDGDGKTDLAIWRPSTGTFWVYRSSDGGVVSLAWGNCASSPCDEPVADWQNQ